MQIANPIYDVVFKYLMEDAKVAKLLISSIIGMEIMEIDFKPQEFSTDVKSNSGDLTVYRLDFSARVKTSEGLRHVLIELQKAKFATDIMRFRNYLGGHYKNIENSRLEVIDKHERRVGIPIISIYFLGHSLDNTTASIIGVNRVCRDLVTNELLDKSESFIESLTHDSYIIQIPSLAKKRRNDLEKLLSIFDQSESVDETHHILNIKEEDYPEKYSSLIRRLHSVVLSPEIRKHMEIEDTVLLNFEDMQRSVMRERELTMLAEQKASEAEQKLAEAELKAIKSSVTTALTLKAAGVSAEIIMQATGLSYEEIEKIV
jgi:hypothetical protein